MKKETQKNFKFIDLFAGIGGIRIPFDELGGECVFSSEIDKFARQTYQTNFNQEPHGDITKIDPKDIPHHDLLIAGFPCQPFSQAGKKRGFDDRRGEMFFYIAEILNYHRPQAILLENVKGFQNHDKGRTLKMVVAILQKLNYKIFYQVLSATNFNLPQNRQRIYIVGFQKNDHNNILFNFPQGEDLQKKVGDILESKVDQKYTISDRIWAGHQRRKLEHKRKGNGFGYSLVDNNSSYTNTISARYYKDGSEILVAQKNNNPRRLTPRECARLQGFPDTYKIPVSDCQAWQQFGNSVAVSVIRAIAHEMVKYIDINNRVTSFEPINLANFIDKKMLEIYGENKSKLQSIPHQQLSLF